MHYKDKNIMHYARIILGGILAITIIRLVIIIDH